MATISINGQDVELTGQDLTDFQALQATYGAEQAATAYAYARVKGYKKLADQLDRLWHDIDNDLLGASAKTGEFYLHIKAVKDANPKP